MSLKQFLLLSLIFLVIMFQLKLNAQEIQSAQLVGKIYNSNKKGLENIYIHNETLRHLTVSDDKGIFEIPVRTKDTLIFYGIQFFKKTHVVSSDDIEGNNIIIELKEVIYELDEVVIKNSLSGSIFSDIKKTEYTKSRVTAKSLNLPNADVHKKTALEFKLYSLSENQGLVYTFINSVSGRTKRNTKMKKILINEKKIVKLFSSYSDYIFSEIMKIPETEIDLFIDYCEKNEKFWEIIKTNNELRMFDFIMEEAKVYKNENGF